MRNVCSAYVEDFSMRLQRFIAKFLFATTVTPVAHAFGVLEPAGLDGQRGTRRVTQ